MSTAPQVTRSRRIAWAALAALIALIAVASALPPAAVAAQGDAGAAAELAARAATAAESGTAAGAAEAVELYGDAADGYRRAGDRAGEVTALLEQAALLSGLGEVRRALAVYDRALPLARDAGDPGLTARTLVYLGSARSQAGEQRQAIAVYREALAAMPGDDPGLEVLARVNLGAAFERSGEVQRALEQYHAALDLARATGHRRGETAALNNLGTVYFSLGDLEAAVEQWQRVVELRRQLGDRAGEARALSYLGQALEGAGDPAAAIDLYRRALPLHREAGDRRAEADTLNNLGVATAALGDPAGALDLHRRALALAEAAEAKRIAAFALDRMGVVHEAQGETERALELYRRALELSRSIGQHGDEAQTLAHLAELHHRGGDLDTAWSELSEALELVEALRTRVGRQDLRQSYFAARRDYYEAAIGVQLDLHRRHPAQGHDAAALAIAERARARSLLDLLNESLADLSEGVDAELLAEERDLGLRLQRAESERQHLLAGPHGDDQAARADAAVEELLARYRDTRARLRSVSPRYASLTQPEPLTAAAIQGRLLDDDTVLLEYFLGRDRGVVWAVTSDGLSAHELPPRAEIEASARRLLDLLTARNRRQDGETPAARRRRVEAADAALAGAAAELARQVLGPVADRLAAAPAAGAPSEAREPTEANDLRRVVVVADGILQYVPFAALPAPGDGARPMVASYEVVHLPSASALAILRRETAGRPPAPHALAVLADPVFSAGDPRVVAAADRPAAPAAASAAAPSGGPGAPGGERVRDGSAGGGELRRLPFSRQEADGIAALVPPGEVWTAYGFAASRDTLAAAGLDRYRLLHFATHAVLDDRFPELSGLVLSQVDEAGRPLDGTLRLLDVYNLHLNAELVTLSACETALGREVQGEGLVGLTRGFLYAGAERVVASLWNVQDRATSELMRRFYRHLLVDGLRPAAALRAAQVSMLADDRWSAPYYWAGFVIQGEWK